MQSGLDHLNTLNFLINRTKLGRFSNEMAQNKVQTMRLLKKRNLRRQLNTPSVINAVIAVVTLAQVHISKPAGLPYVCSKTVLCTGTPQAKPLSYSLVQNPACVTSNTTGKLFRAVKYNSHHTDLF